MADPSAGKRRIKFPAGRFFFSGRLTTISQGMIWEGEGPDNTFIDMTIATLLTVTASDVLFKDLTFHGTGSTVAQLFASIKDLAPQKNWRFENVRFDKVTVRPGKQGAPLQDGGEFLITSGLSSYVEFDNCEWTGYTSDGSLYVMGSDYVTVQNSRFHDIGDGVSSGDMCKFSYGAIGGKILNNKFWNGTRDAIDLYDASQVHVEGNFMTDVGAHAIESKFHSNQFIPLNLGHRVVNNHAIRCASRGDATTVFQLAAPRTFASGNVAEYSDGDGFRTGAAMDDGTNIDLAAWNGVWIGNVSRNNAGDGFLGYRSSKHTLMSNVAHDNDRGFSFIDSTNPGLQKDGNISFDNTNPDVWV